MTIGYDEVIERLVAVVQQHRAWPDLKEVAVVRDLHGRVRLALRGDEADDARRDLDQKLAAELGGWFGGSTLSTSDPGSKQLAAHVLELAEEWPAHWPQDFDDGTGGRRPLARDRWTHIQRVLAKEGWLGSRKSSPAWPLNEKTPAIVAFYSFKGGVGRSTALGIIAWRLARPEADGGPGKRVVVIDLDLEAPGLDGLFGIDRTTVERGVIDWLLETAVGQPTGLRGSGAAPDLALDVTVNRRKITVVPAGKTTGASYLEKLARLDYHGAADSNESPVQRGLKDLLERVKADLTPDYILLDARAGFHDLGGLSLTNLAHVDVIVARHTAATEPGLRMTIDMLRRRRPIEERLLVVAQAFASHPKSANDDPSDRKEFREMVMAMLPRDGPRPVCLEDNLQIAQGFTLSAIPDVTLEGAAGYDELLVRIEALATTNGGRES